MAGVNEAGRLDVTIAVRLEELQRGMKEAERVVTGSAKKMEAANKAAINPLQSFLKVAAFAKIATTGFYGVAAAVDYMAGRISQADQNFLKFVERIPVVGRDLHELAFELSGANKELAAHEIKEQARQRNLKNIATGQQLVQKLEREIKLEKVGTDDAAKQRLQAQFQFDDVIAELIKLPANLAAQIQGLAQQRLNLQLKNIGEGKTANFQEIGARSQFSVAAPQQNDQPKAKQVEKTNEILGFIARGIAKLENQNKTVAQ